MKWRTGIGGAAAPPYRTCMSADFSPELQAELLNDFYSEADEHLKAIRDSVAALEDSAGRAQFDSSVLEVLFRSFHSFKGISAIMGLRPAESLAHVAEDYLRDVSRGTAPHTADGVDLLMSVAHKLEQIVRAHRENQPLPEVESLLKQLSAEPSRPPRAAAATQTSKPITPSHVATDVEVARARGAVVWHCTF